MIKYKLLYEQCVEIWKQDLEFSKILTDKARTYVMVIGIVFGYSLFNIDTFYRSLQTTFGKEPPTVAYYLLKTTSVLFMLYFICFAISLIFTLISLRIRTYSSLPILSEIAKFKERGPTDVELEHQYYDWSDMVQKAIKDNERKIAHQGLCLTIAIWFLTIGAISFILIGCLFIYGKLL